MADYIALHEETAYESAARSQEPPFPLLSLGVLVPPLRMMSALMWQVVRLGNISQYGKLEEFVSMVTEAVPDLLSNRQRWLLTLALRGRVSLQLLGSGHPDDLKAVQTHLDRITASGLKQSNDAAIEFAESNFLKLIQSLVEDPDRKEHFFKVVFPVEYGPSFDSALQTLVCHLLSRLEELLPVPDFKQTALLISGAPSVLEDFMCSVSHAEDLKSLLQNPQCHGKLKLPKSAPSQIEDHLLFSLSLPPSLRLGNASHHSASESKAFPDCENPPLQVRDNQGTMTDNLSGQWAESKTSTDQNVIGTDSVENQGGSQRTDNQKDVKEKDVERQSAGRKAVDTEHQYCLSTNTAPQTADQDTAPSASQQAASASTSVSAQDTTSTSTSGTLSSSSGVSPEQPRRRVAHRCPQCGRCFIYRYKMLEHQRLHTGENPYKCSQCGKTFRRSSEMSTHRRTQCSNAAYVCIKCGSSFGSVRERVSHRCCGSKAAAAPKFECPQCGKNFKWHNSLKKHLVTHTRKKGFNCRYCGEGPFPGIAELRTHQKVHDGEEKPYKCEQCGKGFSSQVFCCIHLPGILLYSSPRYSIVFISQVFCCIHLPGILLYSSPRYSIVFISQVFCCIHLPGILLYSSPRYSVVFISQVFCCIHLPGILLYSSPRYSVAFSLNMSYKMYLGLAPWPRAAPLPREVQDLPQLWKGLPVQRRPEAPHANSHRREAVPVYLLHQAVLCERKPDDTHQDSHGGETFPLL
ncbi:zinc finger and BTB domain-containing protein 17 isoform X4 [Oncorhynchus mykiss]|uniref:zinc finger and BTB domain-containing protein 17 isoform X4 n=1 Tax=Oncorhynchus mykiss TaxID=8022 RepID=UPI001877805F|nr:zinc finger and BTB domain-containing protein 17 isoform X4 [Oncorhynchus mykiss]